MNAQHRDFRGLSEDARAEVRRQAIRNLDGGMGRRAAALLAEVHVKTVGDWFRRGKELEGRGFCGRKRGRTPGEQKALTGKEEARVKKAIEAGTPDDAGVPYALWTRKAILELVRKDSGKRMRLETVSKYTRRWGLTPQRPARYAKEQDAGAVLKWVTEEYPAIAKKAREEGAEIQWEDETGVSLSTFYARSYAPKGRTPAIRLPVRRASLSMISSIASRGDLRFMLYRGALDADRFIVFLGRLVRGADRKIFLIADNLRVHKAKKVIRWVKEHEGDISLFFPASLRPAAQPR